MDGGKTYKVGSRKSQLAMLQTQFVVEKLRALYPRHNFEIVGMSTIGDLILDVSLAKVGEKSMFTKELELAILEGQVDFVVHSLKDLPTKLPEGLTIAAILEREDPRDVVVLPKGQTVDSNLAFSDGAVIGTSSARRTACLRLNFPNCRVADVRGNIQTRLNKLDDPNTPYTALILAAAGLHRLGLSDRISWYLSKPEFDWPYAVGQGALGVECMEANKEVKDLLEPLTHSETYFSCLAERALLLSFGGGCSVPLGVRSFFTTSVGSHSPDLFTIEGHYYHASQLVSVSEIITLDKIPLSSGHESLMTGVTDLSFPKFPAMTSDRIVEIGDYCGRTLLGKVGKLRKLSAGLGEISAKRTSEAMDNELAEILSTEAIME